MNETPQPNILPPPVGYLSEQAKKRYTITAGILGALFFFGQMVVPMVVMVVMMPAMLVGGGFNITINDLVGGALHDGKRTIVIKKRVF